MTSAKTSRAGWLVGARRPLALPGLVLALTATFSGLGWAQPGPPPWHGRGGPDVLGPGIFGGPPELAARRIDHLLDGLGATDAQRSQIKQIAQAAAADLATQHDSGRALHDKSIQLLTAPTVDALAAEQVRQQLLAQHDQASRRTLTALLDISRVLTPDQRAKLAERFKLRQDAMRERAQRQQRDRAAK